MAITSRVYRSEQINVPSNLPGIIKQFSKEVIRYHSQRSNMEEFARDYFTALCNGELDSFLAQCEEEALREAASAEAGAEQRAAKSEDGQGIDAQPVHSPEAISLLRTIFNCLDTDMDEALSFNEIVSGLEGTLLGDLLIPLLNEMEHVEGPIVTFPMFCQWWPPLKALEIENVKMMWLQKNATRVHGSDGVSIYKAVFQKWDADNNGRISGKELVEAVRKARLPAEAIDYMSRADINNDGLLSETEFVAYLQPPAGADEEDKIMLGLMMGLTVDECSGFAEAIGMDKQMLVEMAMSVEAKKDAATAAAADENLTAE
jgi:Ca2+-binding EF-hand superfamily protein